MTISIITVNKNNASGLRLTANSISRCSFISNLEWIVIDGKSTDDSIRLISDYNHFISRWISEPDQGIYDAMNKGLQMVTGDYVIFMNSGDCFVDIDHLIGQGLSWDADIVYGDYFTRDSKNVLSPTKQPANLDFAFILGRTINHQSYLIKSHLLNRYTFNTHYSIVADWIQLFEILKNENVSTHYLDFPICVFDSSGFSSKNNYKRKVQRLEYLNSLYSVWELDSLLKLSRIRQRKWYEFLLKSLDSPKRSRAILLLSRILG
ncbi:MAG: hypothetical protein RLZ10_1798 [Bacteroidota bacterium]